MGALSKNTSLTNTRNNILAIITTGRSKNLVIRVSTIGAMIAVTQRIRSIFAILEPSIFPMAISVFHRILAITETRSSGILVPTATIVRPIIASETRNFFAMDTAQSTSIFPPNVKRISPNITENIGIKIAIIIE